MKTPLFNLVCLLLLVPFSYAIPTPENALWSVFNNQQGITAILLSSDKQQLWLATDGGLLQRDAHSGRLQHVFSGLDGLPSTQVNALAQTQHSPVVSVNSADSLQCYQLALSLRNTDPIEPELDMQSLQAANNTSSALHANFSPLTGALHIPSLDIGAQSHTLDLGLLDKTPSLHFTLKKLYN